MTSTHPRSLLPALMMALVMTSAGLGAVTMASGFSRSALVANGRPAVVFIATALAIWVSFYLARFNGDRVLFVATVALLGISLVTVYRLLPDLVFYRGFSEDLADRHLIYVVLALITIWAVTLFSPDPERIANYRYLILSGGILLLVVTALFGTSVYGARIWIDVGPLLVQPPEFVKLALIFFLASYLAEKMEVVAAGWQVGRVTLPPLPYLLPIVLMAGGCLLILTALNDLGTALLLFTILLTMFYAATAKATYVAMGIALFVSVAWIAYQLVDRLEIRVANWIDPWRDPFVAGYQQIQSDYAIASGGVWGTGIGEGSPAFIPVVEADFIFSAIAEEMGFLVAIAVLGLYVVLVARGLRIAMQATSDVHRLIAIGCAMAIGFQAIIILAGVLRLLPLTGVTLPFISAGGSSLISNAIAVGLLLKISTMSPGVKS